MNLRKSLITGSVCVAASVAAALVAASLTAKATQTPSATPPLTQSATRSGAVAPPSLGWDESQVNAVATTTPIKHLVIIYQENVSFDHYFGTYPLAANPAGEPRFVALPNTPKVNGLSPALLTSNPNAQNAGNGADAINPFRLDAAQAATADQNHAYTAEQQAEDNGAADLFPKYTGKGSSGGAGAFGTRGLVMGYFDGNTLTALWNYAQHYAMSDNAYADTYGPSTPGALEAVAGQTDGFGIVVNTNNKTTNFIPDGQGGFTMINDIDPAYDVCSSPTDTGMINAKNIGDLLNQAKITWGGFMGGFDLNATNINGTTGCARATANLAVPAGTRDYVPHHNWFQYFASTANPTHARPASLAAIGYSFDHDGQPDPANHEYDLTDFYAAVAAHNFPSVSYIKLIAAQDGHAGYSDPLDEQQGLMKLVAFLKSQPDWKHTAIIIAYDDSDGWYDHAFTAATHGSFDTTADQLNAPGICGTPGTAPLGVGGLAVNGRCGPGMRIPFLVISPWAKKNYVDHTLISQASIVRFIEDNWLNGTRLGGGSFDATTGSINGMFNFNGNGDDSVTSAAPQDSN